LLFLVVLPVALALLSGCATPTTPKIATALHFDPAELPVPDPAGPTLKFTRSAGHVLDCPIADFMYLIPLVSPEPMSVFPSPGNTQRVRVTLKKRRVTRDSFLVEYNLGLAGAGSLRNAIDHTPNIRRNTEKIRTTGVIERVLDSITVGSPGSGSMEIEGVITNGLASVNEVRFRFNSRGNASPVQIGVGDLRVTNDVGRIYNEHIARVNTLGFRRGPEARVAVSIGSIRRKDGGEGLWSRIAGLALNIALKPIKVNPTGHEAILNLGRQLVGNATTFTFPQARTLGQGQARSDDSKE